jgi:adenosine deaminase
MPVVTRTLLEALPKAELHCHLDGSLRPSTMLELARDQRVRLPRDDVESLAEFMLVRDAVRLEDYLERFAVTLSVLQTGEALERAAFELAEDAAREGVRYLEARYAPVLNVEGGLTLGATIEAPLRGLARARDRYGIESGVIVCALRTLPPETSLRLARLAAEFVGHGVVGFDLAGAEAGHPAEAHAAAFAHARTHGVHCTCHAGEGAGAASVASALTVCRAERIGHATHLYEDTALSEAVRREQIPLEICLTSNVQTRAVTSYDTHPLRGYFDAGMNVVLNTDNRLMSGVSLVDEYLHAACALGFTWEELSRIALNGFRSAFADEATRARLLAEAEAAIAGLCRP